MINDRHLDLPRGFHDTGPPRMAVYRSLQQEWFDTCALFGFQPVAVPPTGFADTYTTAHHAAGEKLYRLADRRNRELALVSDSLPALLRLAHNRGLPEQRLSYCCPIFRYERRPRRHFHHLGLMEVSTQASDASARLRSTARIAEVITRYLTPRLPVTLTVTNPGLWHAIAEMTTTTSAPDDLVNTLRRLPAEQRPARLRVHGASPEIIRLAEDLVADPTFSRALPTHQAATPRTLSDHIRACHQLAEIIQRHGADATIDLGELHAAEFHDGPAFLIQTRDEQRLLGDGGLYGRFAKGFLNDAAATAVSAVVGLERLADLLISDATTPPAADIAILTHPGHDTTAHADALCTALRSAGVAVWDLVITKPLRHHLRDLANPNIPCSLIVGAQELTATDYTVRDIDGTLCATTQDQLTQSLLNRRNQNAH
jgi:histidyl-tRNA synthetase